ncbi:lipase [Rhodococcus sp. PAMC28707]|uniref:lipase family protein n=1 Tax=unclassified Rhodococcus (in: high G+C Gram-positive bacteria) TaxID=192944 RepID=UPI00109E2BFB|nr:MULTISPECIES: lipase family protein [unclassified Rhodococcus (in: high G+C Gram-positive bacteria)]QCB49439.1 lipase [Rhodococcus sp. PAMC28705]QCB58873.1 lipase [Rhodococcus sp. PAMC28707]
MKRAATVFTATVASIAVVFGAQAVAQAEPVSTPGLDEIFTDYTTGMLEDGEFASVDEITEALTPNDSFYDEPELTGNEAPGMLLESQPAQVMFAGFQPGNLDAYKVMYVTRGVDDMPAISTGILLIPIDGRDNVDRPIIGYQEANDSVGAYCHPSSLWTGANPLDSATWSAVGPLTLMLDKGYAVMISDVGNGGDSDPHGVFAGKFGGQSNLDGLRAALQVEEAGLSKDAPIGIFGIAGGGVGAAVAAEIQPEYAPELNVKSAVLEGMVVNQKNFMRTADGSVGSGFAFANLLGLEPWYPEMKIDEKLTPVGKEIASFYRTQCQTPAYFAMPFVPLQTLFIDGQSPVDIPDFQPAFEDNKLGKHAPQAKVLITSCGADDSPMSLVPAQDSRDLAEKYRAGGTDVTYAPSDCSMSKTLTDPFGWSTDLYGMQTIDWLDSTLQ